MHVIRRKKLLEGAQRRHASETPLDVWYRIAKNAEWKSLEDVRKTFPNADGVTVGKKTYTGFNIGGNKFRLVVEIEYVLQRVYVRDVLTNAEYHKGAWSNERSPR